MTDDLHTPDAAPLPEPEPQEPPLSTAANTRRIDLKYNPHEGIDEPYFIFPNNQQGIAAAADLSTYISRARSLDTQAAIRLTARGSVLAVFACSLAPETMLDNTPTILGMRALNLAKPSTLDIVVDSAALLERLARIEESEMVLYLPPVTVHTEWAGKAAPLQGWEKLGTIDADQFRRASRDGLTAVEKALPENPGAAVLTTVRTRIWSSPMVLEHLPEFDRTPIPTGAAFALQVFGFLPETFTGELAIYAARTGSDGWVRIAAPGGHVLVRSGSGALA